MPFIISPRRGRRVLVTALGLVALLATPALAKGPIANPGNCVPDALVSPIFAPWADFGQYTPVANQGFENGSASWTLSGGATVVSGNEPWKVGGSSHANSLDLPAGSSAVTAPICIDETYPYFRLFARNAGVSSGSLTIDVLGYDSKGKLVKNKSFSHATTSTTWQPTGMVGIGVFTRKTTVAAAPVAFRFTATGKGARYQIDDVYVDPWSRG